MTVFVVVDGDEPGKVKEVCRITDVTDIQEEVKDKEKNLVFSVPGGKQFKHSLLDFSFIIGREAYVGDRNKQQEETQTQEYGPQPKPDDRVVDAEIVNE